MLHLQTGCEMEGFLMSIITDGILSNSQGITVTLFLLYNFQYSNVQDIFKIN